MNKKILSVILVAMILMNYMMLSGSVKATESVLEDEVASSDFIDVSDTHWARSYIYLMQAVKIINGYGDGTFKPENQVKTGEFIKMVAMAMYPSFEYKAPAEDEADGTHWSKPYVLFMDGKILKASEYNDERMERYITRTEAAELICKMYMRLNLNDDEKNYLDESEKNIKEFTDEALVTDSNSRKYIDNCVRFGIINGFEDGSFRPNESLTRAQAAKIIYIAKYN